MFQATKKIKDKQIKKFELITQLRGSIIRSVNTNYNSGNDPGKQVINHIIFNIKSHILTAFKEYLIIFDKNEFFKRYCQLMT